jgi:hypothetical protein
MCGGAVVVVAVAAALLLTSSAALASHSYPDRLGDVKGGGGPDIASIAVSNTKTTVTFRVRFAKAPPLRLSTREQWIDMLLIGLDVPPFGPSGIPGGEWNGANFALGTHGPSKTGLLVRLGEGRRPPARFAIVTTGPTLTFSVARRALGNPAAFSFTVAAGREMMDESSSGGSDFAPARGSFRYALTG